MDYQRAARVRKTGLFRLIAQKKFEKGQGLGTSIGGAISEKFKAKGMGIKEAFDPLNITRKLFGKGTFGDIAVTGLGRLMGRKDRDIGYFGGFKRKRKDPKYTSIGAGPIKPVVKGDGTADVLAKMYNFMTSVNEKRKLQDELDRTFKQEQADKEEQRHQNLIKAITGGRKVTASKVTKSEEGGGIFDFLTGLIDSIKEQIAAILEQITSILSWISNASKMLGVSSVAAVPLAIAVGGAVATGVAGAILSSELTKEQQKVFDKDKDPYGMASAMSGDTGLASQIMKGDEKERKKQNILLEASKKGEFKSNMFNFVGRAREQNEYLKKIGWDEETGTTQEERDKLAKEQKTETKVPENKTTASKAVEESPATPAASPAPKNEPAPVEPPKVEENKSNVPPPPIEPSKEVNIPKVETSDINGVSGQQGAPNVSVNNTVNNIGGKKPKIINTDAAKQRNGDLDRYLRNTVVPV
jgi:hypothetical protein